MGAFATADPDTRIIQLTKVPVNGVVTLDVVVDIYSDLKEDWVVTPALQNLEFPFRSIGDPKTPTQQIGPYVFIRNDLGWRLRPYDGDHELTLNGNLVAEDTSAPKYVYPAGRTVSILEEQSAQALTTVADVEGIQFSSFQNVVTIDVINGVAGTAYPIGTGQVPVNNVADAIAIASTRGLRTLQVDGSLTLGAGDVVSGYRFVGLSPVATALTVDPAAVTTDCEFQNLHLTGTLDGNSTCYDCVIGNLTFFNGVLYECLLEATITLGGGVKAVLLDCASAVPGGGAGQHPTIDGGGAGQQLAIRSYHGGIDLTNFTGADSHSIDMASGRVVIDTATVTNGHFTIRGVTEVEDENGDPLVTGALGAGTLTVQAVSGLRQVFIEKLLRNRFETDPTTGVATIYDDDGVTPLYTAPIYEDVAGTQPYQGSGIERRDRFS